MKEKCGKKIELDYEYDKYGLIKITVPKSGYIEMKYAGTLMYQIFSWVRNLGILIFIIIVIKYQYNKKKKILHQLIWLICIVVVKECNTKTIFIISQFHK